MAVNPDNSHNGKHLGMILFVHEGPLSVLYVHRRFLSLMGMQIQHGLALGLCLCSTHMYRRKCLGVGHVDKVQT